MKPTTRPIFFCARSRLNPFLDACHAIALQPNLQRSASHALVGWSTLRPRLTRHPASPRPHAANEENAALRKAIEDADYEYGVGLLRLNQLDWTSSPWSPRRRPSEEAQLCLHQEQLISQPGLPQCVRLSFAGREEEQLCFQHCPWTTTQPGRGQRLAGGDDKHSQPNAELAKGRQVRMPHARPSTRRRGWTSSATEWRCSTRTAAMAPRCQPYVPPHTPATVGGATRSDPHLLSIASPGSPECRMRCAIAHF